MRIGPQMEKAANIVAENPGCCKRFVALRLIRSTRLQYLEQNCAIGYNPVNRAIKAALIRQERTANGYRLYPVNVG